MATLTVSARGQVTFRQEILRHLGLKPGDKIEVELLPNGQGLVRAASATGRIEDFIGCLAGKSPKVASLDEINAATEKAWAGRR